MDIHNIVTNFILEAVSEWQNAISLIPISKQTKTHPYFIYIDCILHNLFNFYLLEAKHKNILKTLCKIDLQ